MGVATAGAVARQTLPLDVGVHVKALGQLELPHSWRQKLLPLESTGEQTLPEGQAILPVPWEQGAEQTPSGKSEFWMHWRPALQPPVQLPVPGEEVEPEQAATARSAQAAAARQKPGFRIPRTLL